MTVGGPSSGSQTTGGYESTVDLELSSARDQLCLGIPCSNEWFTPDGKSWARFFKTANGYVLRFPDLADYDISPDGRQVVCHPTPSVSAETCQHLYLNQVLPLALSKQGQLVFHAAAVEITNGAIALIGTSGLGKSTLTASFATNGYRFLTDDSLVLEPAGSRFDALPGHASIRLWNTSRERLVASKPNCGPSQEYSPKMRFLADEDVRFCAQRRPLLRAYFLGDGSVDTVQIEPLSGAAALMEWVKHSFLLDLEEKSRVADHFDQVARLSKQPIHYRLDYPRRFENLGQVRAAIVEHVRSEDIAV